MQKAETKSRAGTAAPGRARTWKSRLPCPVSWASSTPFSPRSKRSSRNRKPVWPCSTANPSRSPARRWPAAPRPRPPHKKAFAAYLRSGDDDGLRGLTVEEKALSTAVAADGGYLVDPQTAAQIVGVLRSSASIRTIANVVTVEASAFDVLVDHTDIGAGWATETARGRDRHAAGRPHLDPAARALGAAEGEPAAARRQRLRRRGLAGAAHRRQVQPRRGRGLRRRRRHRQADRLPELSQGRQRALRLGLARLCADRRGRRLQRHRSGGRDRRPGLCAGRALPGQRDLRDELQDRRRGAQDEGRGRAVPVVGRARRRRAGAADGLSGADRRGHAGHRGERLSRSPTATSAPAIPWRSGRTCASCAIPFSAKPHVLFYATKRIGGDVSDFAAIKLLKFASA